MKQLTTIPTNCHLWLKRNNHAIFSNDDLLLIKNYGDCQNTVAEHCERRLLKCKQCGQLYLKESLEFIDWQDGDDKQYYSFFPVVNARKATELNKLSSMDILKQEPWFEPTLLPTGQLGVDWHYEEDE